MGMSYRRAWALIASLNETFAGPLVTACTGGTGGGRAELTAKGQEVVRAYRAIEAQASTVAASDLHALQSSLASAATPKTGKADKSARQRLDF